MIKNSLSPLVALFITLASFVAALAIGAADVSLSEVIAFVLGQTQQLDTFTQTILWELRLPRSVLAFIAGSGLALAGCNLQIVTRNPLADPYLFGISSGASFGVVLAMALFGFSFGIGLSLAAFIGGIVSVVLLLVIAGINRSQQVESMLLAGVALSFLFSAFTSLILYWTDPQAVTAILFWTLGSFSRADWGTLWLPAIVVSVCLIIMLANQKKLTALLLGDESAFTLGINPARLRVQMLALSSLITACLVALCGGIGFVGLMIPHIVRFFVSQGNRWSFVSTALCGGVFMLWVDIASRIALQNQELPIGIITSAIGSVFFLTMLFIRRQKRQRYIA